MKKISQIKTNSFLMRLAGVQVQFQNAMIYINMWSISMILFTFWHTTGGTWAARYLPWFELWMFVAIGAFCLLVLMFIDFLVLLPARLAFQNNQTVRTQNPAWDEINAIRSELKDLADKFDKFLEAQN